MPETADYSPYGHPKGHTNAEGNWVRNVDEPIVEAGGSGSAIDDKIPISFAMADGAVLLTVSEPILLTSVSWEITERFVGTGMLGVSTTAAPNETKGDLLGGVAGDGEDTLQVGLVSGTKGTNFVGTTPLALPAGTVIRLDLIGVGTFTAGEGFVILKGNEAT